MRRGRGILGRLEGAPLGKRDDGEAAAPAAVLGARRRGAGAALQRKAAFKRGSRAR